jgi:hypothetical protein
LRQCSAKNDDTCAKAGKKLTFLTAFFNGQKPACLRKSERAKETMQLHVLIRSSVLVKLLEEKKAYFAA